VQKQKRQVINERLKYLDSAYYAVKRMRNPQNNVPPPIPTSATKVDEPKTPPKLEPKAGA
jgi:hypothetical protein